MVISEQLGSFLLGCLIQLVFHTKVNRSVSSLSATKVITLVNLFLQCMTLMTGGRYMDIAVAGFKWPAVQGNLRRTFKFEEVHSIDC